MSEGPDLTTSLALAAELESIAKDPVSIHGRKMTVWNLLLDVGVKQVSPSSAFPLASFAGVAVHHDETMPDGVVEFRNADGEVVHRLLNTGVKWVAEKIEGRRRG